MATASKTWVMVGNDQGTVFHCVVHFATPAGNNSAGITWVNAVLAAGRNTTRLATGTNPWQQTTAEAAAISAGTTVEVEGDFEAGSDPPTVARLTAWADALATREVNRLSSTLKWVGFTQ